MDAAASATIAAATIAILGLGFGLVQYWERRRQRLLTDLRDGKEAAAVATRVAHGQLPRRKRTRRELLEAMCVAAVFGQTGQARSLIYAALAKMMVTEDYRDQITASAEDLAAIIARNSPYADLTLERHRLLALRAALSIDDDLRMRVERADIYLNQVNDAMTPDGRCADEIHRWGALKEVLKHRGSVVVVCPRPGPGGSVPGCATLALDFHKVAQTLGTTPPAVPVGAMARARFDEPPILSSERFLLTDLGKRFHRAKYHGSFADVKSIAAELASIIVRHPAYEKAEMIAVISGRSHDFSVQLGNEAARLSAKPCITLTKQGGPDAESRFMLAESDSVRDREIILMDDVYRTGDTMRDATRALRRAGARQVLGLTATCAISAIALQ
jgi:hypothetical protein